MGRKSQKSKKIPIELLSYHHQALKAQAAQKQLSKPKMLLICRAFHTLLDHSFLSVCELCRYVHTIETQLHEASFHGIGLSCKVTHYPSNESLAWMSNLLHSALLATNTHIVMSLDVKNAFVQACFEAYGIPMLCVNKKEEEDKTDDDIPKKPLPLQEEDNNNNNNDSKKQQQQHMSWTRSCYMPKITTISEQEASETKVLFFELCLDMNWQPLLQTVLLTEAQMVVVSGPTHMLALFATCNHTLILKYGFYRQIYALPAIASDHTMFDGNHSSVSAVVYCHHDLKDLLPTEYVLDSPVSIFRQHFVRHALIGDIPQWWKLLACHVPFPLLLKYTRHSGIKTCVFEQSMVSFFSDNTQVDCGGHDVQQQQQQQLLLLAEKPNHHMEQKEDDQEEDRSLEEKRKDYDLLLYQMQTYLETESTANKTSSLPDVWQFVLNFTRLMMITFSKQEEMRSTATTVTMLSN